MNFISNYDVFSQLRPLFLYMQLHGFAQFFLVTENGHRKLKICWLLYLYSLAVLLCRVTFEIVFCFNRFMYYSFPKYFTQMQFYAFVTKSILSILCMIFIIIYNNRIITVLNKLSEFTISSVQDRNMYMKNIISNLIIVCVYFIFNILLTFFAVTFLYDKSDMSVLFIVMEYLDNIVIIVTDMLFSFSILEIKNYFMLINFQLLKALKILKRNRDETSLSFVENSFFKAPNVSFLNVHLVRNLRNSFDSLCGLCESINSVFTVCILISIAIKFISITAYTYHVILGINSHDSLRYIYFLITSSVLIFIIFAAPLIYMVYCCDSTSSMVSTNNINTFYLFIMNVSLYKNKCLTNHIFSSHFSGGQGETFLV